MKNDVVEELFIKYYNDALLYVLSLSRNKALAKDAVSTAFFKALRGGDALYVRIGGFGFEGNSSLAGF